jgi:hypothetical protein
VTEAYLTESQIREAIDAWAEARVDEHIAESIERNKEYNEKYGGRTDYWNRNKRTPWPTTVEEFNREDEIQRLAEDFYEAYGESERDLPGLGLAKLVDSYGGEGQGDDYWQVWEIAGKFYKADHYYNSYDVEPWHGNASWFPVVGREKVVTEWVQPS